MKKAGSDPGLSRFWRLVAGVTARRSDAGDEPHEMAAQGGGAIESEPLVVERDGARVVSAGGVHAQILPTTMPG